MTAAPMAGAPAATRQHRIAPADLAVFLALAYALSWWPWPLASLSTRPDAAVMLPVGPSLAAVVVLMVRHRHHELSRLLASVLAVRIGRLWWVLTVPVITAAVTLTGAVALGATAPSTSQLLLSMAAGVATLPVTLVLAGPLGEELGWRGYLLPALLRRLSRHAATAVTTVAWVGFHLPLILTRPAQYGPGWALTLLGVSAVMTRLHLVSHGSLALAVTFHAAVNTTTSIAIRALPDSDQAVAWVISGLVWAMTGLAATLHRARHRSRRASCA